MRVLTLFGLAAALAGAACEPGPPESPPPAALPAPAAEPFPLEGPGEIAAEVEILGHEIDDLEAWLTEPPTQPPADGGEARALLAAARTAREGAIGALAAGDTAAALDSLAGTAARIEAVKRTLGLAEEWGVEVEDADVDGT